MQAIKQENTLNTVWIEYKWIHSENQKKLQVQQKQYVLVCTSKIIFSMHWVFSLGEEIYHCSADFSYKPLNPWHMEKIPFLTIPDVNVQYLSFTVIELENQLHHS